MPPCRCDVARGQAHSTAAQMKHTQTYMREVPLAMASLHHASACPCPLLAVSNCVKGLNVPYICCHAQAVYDGIQMLVGPAALQLGDAGKIDALRRKIRGGLQTPAHVRPMSSLQSCAVCTAVQCALLRCACHTCDAPLHACKCIRVGVSVRYMH